MATLSDDNIMTGVWSSVPTIIAAISAYSLSLSVVGAMATFASSGHTEVLEYIGFADYVDRAALFGAVMTAMAGIVGIHIVLHYRDILTSAGTGPQRKYIRSLRIGAALGVIIGFVAVVAITVYFKSDISKMEGQLQTFLAAICVLGLALFLIASNIDLQLKRRWLIGIVAASPLIFVLAVSICPLQKASCPTLTVTLDNGVVLERADGVVLNRGIVLFGKENQSRFIPIASVSQVGRTECD